MKNQAVLNSTLKVAVKNLLKTRDFSFIKTLSRKFPDSEIYLVGGAVRDIILDRKEIKDYDFVVRNVPARRLEAELKKLGWVDLLGRQFGVLKFVPKNSKQNLEAFDIALPRTEKAWGVGGYKDFDIQSNAKLPIEEDLMRRDFTINAIAAKIYPKFEIVDPYDGTKDIKTRKIKTVGNPQERFKEDFSRLLRALRFSCQLDFKIEAKTYASLKKMIGHLNDVNKNERVVPVETIAKEFIKAFHANPVKAFGLYDDSLAFKKLMPEILKMKGCPQPKIFHSEGDVWQHTRMALNQLNSAKFHKFFGPEKASPLITVAVLFHDIGKPPTMKTPEKDGTDRIRFNGHDMKGVEMTRKIFEKYKFPAPPGVGIPTEQVAWLIQHHLLLVYSTAEKLNNTTIEKYFFNPNVPGKELLQMLFCDGSATIPKGTGGKPMIQGLEKLMKRIKSLEKWVQAKRQHPANPILNGDEIMKRFKLKPGKQIGELLGALREKQLARTITNKTQAETEIKKLLKKLT